MLAKVPRTNTSFELLSNSAFSENLNASPVVGGLISSSSHDNDSSSSSSSCLSFYGGSTNSTGSSSLTRENLVSSSPTTMLEFITAAANHLNPNLIVNPVTSGTLGVNQVDTLDSVSTNSHLKAISQTGDFENHSSSAGIIFSQVANGSPSIPQLVVSGDFLSAIAQVILLLITLLIN
ncbi:unnamed protein product [Protopolystoma xenopodis]|uniref:Uncharacterized protein n=1 Tax=Protopolystoma xenopodis TaxID=117903 RepID=A0A3S5B4J1_9PLAT|nr:unnamed protein product [Protopolystoma xenopodis]